MSDQPYGSEPVSPVQQPGAAPSYPPSADYTSQQPPPYGTDPYQGQGYGGQPPYNDQQPYGQYGAPAAAGGLSDNTAGGLAYITIVPAIIFLVMEPYNQKPFIKFHAYQELGLAVCGFVLGLVNIIPILGQIVFLIGMLVLLVLWVMCVVKAFNGSAFKLPVIGNFAAQQSGYPI